MSDQVFTASAFARALSCSRQNVHQRLAHVPAEENRINGNLTKTWNLLAPNFPKDLFEKLAEMRDKTGCRSIAHLLADPPARTVTNRGSIRRAISVARQRNLQLLEDAFEEVRMCMSERGLSSPSVDQKDTLWTKGYDEIRDGTNEKKTKRVVLKLFLESGWFGADKETIRRSLNRGWNYYRANNCRPKIDGRRRRRKEPVPEKDTHVIAGYHHALGSLDAAYNAARENGDLSPETDARYATNVRRAPHRISRAATPVIRSTASLVKGERAFREDGPSLIGDYSGLFAGEVFEMDDWTPEHICYDLHQDGRPGYRFLQGQLIVVLDVASRRVLEASFTDGAYSALMIRVTLNRACLNYCLCDRLNIESGLWKRSRVIVGRKTVGLDEYEMGLREFMLVTNNRKARGKSNIENHFNALGKIMRVVPGWCGNDMRTTMPERLKHNVALAGRGEIHPSTFCLSKQEMFQALLDALATYNARPQPTGRLKDSSPDQAWNAKQSPSGRPVLGSKGAYLLAYHRERVGIRKSQIVKSYGGKRYVYHSPDVARFDRRDVLLWWNPEDLSLIGFSSLDRKEGPWIVPLQESTPVTAEPNYDAIRSAQSKIDKTLAVRRVMFASIKPWLAKAKLRPTTVDSPTATFGESLETGFATAKAERPREDRAVRAAQDAVRMRGLNIYVDTKNAGRAKASAELINEAYKQSNE